MLIKDLISQLEALYNEYTDADKEIMGEPGISIDLFRQKYPGSPNYDRQYAGISQLISIEKHPHNWFEPVIVSFAEDPVYEDYRKKYQTQEFPSSAWPKEESWKT